MSSIVDVFASPRCKVKMAMSSAILALPLLGCGQPQGTATYLPARQAIDAWYEVAEEAFSRGDSQALAEVYTEDAELFVMDGPLIRGKRAIAEYWEGALGEGGARLDVQTLEVQEIADWAYETGRFTASTPTGQQLFVGKYIVIWKRDANGDWKVHRDISNWEVPPGPPPVPADGA